MLVLGFKNYFKSFRFFFVPLGALSLGIVAGLSVMVPMSIGAIKAFIAGVAKMMGQLSVDWNAVKTTLLDAVKSLNWENPENILSMLGAIEYWMDLLRRCAEAAVGDTSEMATQFEGLVGEAVTKIATSLTLGVFLSVIGGVVGYYATRSLIRHDIAKRSVWKAILNGIVKTIINFTVIAFGVWLIGKAEKYGILAFLLTVLLYGSVSFFEAYLVHGYKKIPFKKVMRVKNLFELPILTVVEFGLAAGIYAVVSAITNSIVGAYVAFAVFVITIICAQLNAEAYVKSLAVNEGKDTVDGKSFGAAYAELAPDQSRRANRSAAVKAEAPEQIATSDEQASAEAALAEPPQEK